MEREEINNIEADLENIAIEYKENTKWLHLTELSFALDTVVIAIASFSPIPLLIKVPLIFASSMFLINNDCKRVELLNRCIELKKLRDSYIENEESNSVVENRKQNKLGLTNKFKKMFSKEKEETLPLPNEEQLVENINENNLEEVEVSSEENKSNIFRKINDKIKNRRKKNEDKLIENNEKELLDIDEKPSVFKLIANFFNKKKNNQELPLPVEENEVEEDIDETLPELVEETIVKRPNILKKIKNIFKFNNKTEVLPLPVAEENNQIVSNLDIKDVDKINEVNKLSKDDRKATVIKMPNLSENIEGKVKYMVNADDFITQNIIASYLYGQTGEIVKPRTRTVEGENVKVYTINK